MDAPCRYVNPDTAQPDRLPRDLQHVPKPIRNPVPILIGGGGEKKTLRITAQFANMWHSFGDPATYSHKIEVLNNWCAEIGRNPQEIEHACGTPRNANPAELDSYIKA